MDSSPIEPQALSESPIPRRDLLLTALWGVCGIGMAMPLARYFAAPLVMQSADPRIPVATIPLQLAEGPAWQPVALEFAVQDGWARGRSETHHAFVRKNASNDVVEALSAVCPHLGCTVLWIEQEQVFHCPCHAGRFDPDGQRISGPPQKPLQTLPCKVVEGELRVSLPRRDEATPA